MASLKTKSSKKPSPRLALLVGTSKYGNQRVVVNGEKFRSKKEARRHGELLLLQRAGLVVGLVREVAFALAPGVKFSGDARAKPALRYVADFVYTDVALGRVVVEDCKGFRTDVYRMKRHLMLSVLGIEVAES